MGTSCAALQQGSGSDLSVPVEDGTKIADVAKLAFITSDVNGDGVVEGVEWLTWSTIMFAELNKLYNAPVVPPTEGQ